jgi:hypothetical protein
VRWQACHGRTYKVYGLDDLGGVLLPVHLDDVTVTDSGASPPWFETEGKYEHAGGGTTNRRCYYIKLEE